MIPIHSEIQTFAYDNGEIQRVQVVRFDDFNQLQFFYPEYGPLSFDKLCNLYKDFIIKKYASVFGKIVIFRIGDHMEIPFDTNNCEFGQLFDVQSAVTLAFKKHIHCVKNQLVFSDSKVEQYFNALQENGDLFVGQGKRNKVTFLPVGKQMGFMSSYPNAALKVNSNFFVMDQLDCGSNFDHVGIPIGLAVQQGKILNPPQFDREVFMVDKNGKAQITKINLEQLVIEIDGVCYRHNENCRIYQRPTNKHTPKGKMDIIIANNKVVGLNPNGNSPIPSGGFVIQINDSIEELHNLDVCYHGLEDIIFAIQVGNSSIVNGIKTEQFISPFYKFYNLLATSFPPSMYPLNYRKARAPRIVLGVDSNQKGMLLWFEGAGKFGYEPGRGSCGASLSEAAEICQKIGMVNGVHLDGGGSAQILYHNQRYLEISDRDPIDFAQQERAIPIGLIIK